MMGQQKQAIKAEVGVSVRNTFDFELKNTITGEVKRYKSHNIVLDSFLAGIVSGGSDINRIAVGTGTGTLSPTRTSLFSLLGHFGTTTTSASVQPDVPERDRVRSVTLLENQGNGNLTEVGLARGGSASALGTLVTHSLITDAEGNPISIQKTNTDILTIRATIYGKVLFGDSPYVDMRLVASSIANSPMPANNWSAHLLWDRSVDGNVLTPGNIDLYGVRLKNPIGNSHGRSVVAGNAPSVSRNTAERRIRVSISRAANQDNRTDSSNPYLIKTVRFNGMGEIKFPNENVFPRTSMELLVGIGDGVQTNFNLPFPQCNVGDETIYVDGVVQDPDTYDFNGKNMSFPQAWRSLDTEFLMEDSGSVVSALRLDEWWFFPQSVNMQNTGAAGTTYTFLRPTPGSPFTYDFEEPITVNCLRGIRRANNDTMPNITLEYSHDLQEWHRAATNWVPPTATGDLLIDPITARYWRYWTSVNWPLGIQNSAGISNFFRFDELRDGLIFNEPPPDGAVIMAQVTSDYPWKDETRQYGTSVDFFINQVQP